MAARMEDLDGKRREPRTAYLPASLDDRVGALARDLEVGRCGLSTLLVETGLKEAEAVSRRSTAAELARERGLIRADFDARVRGLRKLAEIDAELARVRSRAIEAEERAEKARGRVRQELAGALR